MKQFIYLALLVLFALFNTGCECKKSNEAPTVTISGDENRTLNTDTNYTFTATADDTDGNITGYEWTLDDEVVSKDEIYVFNETEEGNYTLTVTVTDDGDNTATDTVNIITEENDNDAPTAIISNGATASVQVDETITLNGETSNDSDGSIASFRWTNSSNTTLGSGSSYEYKPTEQGSETITLTVTDNDGATGTDSIVVTATVAENDTPTADAGRDVSVTVSEPAQLDGGGSSDDGSIETWKWTTSSTGTFSDDSTMETDYTPTVVGNHTITLTVTDNDGATDTDTAIVEAKAVE